MESEHSEFALSDKNPTPTAKTGFYRPSFRNDPSRNRAGADLFRTKIVLNILYSSCQRSMFLFFCFVFRFISNKVWWDGSRRDGGSRDGGDAVGGLPTLEG